ncbi:sodium-dependent transporter [uncultured Ilyobacter sp.]|uniref:sodium-dependent transporter n=1 Tax=uncultured Ilyobacter sp. TaxID=544433 RepID=UPI0029F4651C|nr:sodium-dependent transporter [uncultured Ilyobacter sp.]
MSKKNRGEWGSRIGFIMAAIGSAVGLGNIWRFPYTAASNGGGAFLIPYMIALLTAGIPILILEFGLGHKIRSSAPGVFRSLNKKWQAFGWWQTAISFAITVYYMVVIAWAMSYLKYAFTTGWGEDTKGFLFGTYLNLSDSPMHLGGLNLKVVIPLLLIWGINFTVLRMGIKGGIEKASKIFMPLLVISLIAITIRGVTLPGAAKGLEYFFKPDFSRLTDPKVWVAAYGQIFYSLSIAFGIMLAYSSYLPKDSDIVNNAFITGLGNCSFSILSGIGVFSILGYMAQTQGVEVSEVASAGVGLAFIVFPKAITALPGMNSLFGVTFFLSLLFAGISSSISLVETVLSAIIDNFGMERKKALNVVVLVGLCTSLIFATGAGLYILDIVDHYINNYGVAVAGLVEIILLSWFFNLESIREYVNPLSDFKVGKWWNFCLKFLTPAILGVMIVKNIIGDISSPYEGYSMSAIGLYGGGFMLGTILLAVILPKFVKIKAKTETEKEV